MTTLVLLESPRDAIPGPSSIASLREWLGEHWAILFSHPGDFDREQLERDRWIRVLERGFSQHAVRPLALAKHGHDAHEASLGWLDELGDGCAAQLSTAMPQNAQRDLPANTLRAEILQSRARFAMIIDSDLRCRQTARYRAAIDLPSPLELLGRAVALRGRGDITRSRCHRY